MAVLNARSPLARPSLFFVGGLEIAFPAPLIRFAPKSQSHDKHRLNRGVKVAWWFRFSEIPPSGQYAVAWGLPGIYNLDLATTLPYSPLPYIKTPHFL